ncbi:MAG: DUF5067 domain-containing protein [Carnobacterium sp.]|uniref:DUF5067 domain-containing protein n=1 Tax=Carnobacterium sp. TaxID=48221 RepID=UPI003314A4CA
MKSKFKFALLIALAMISVTACKTSNESSSSMSSQESESIEELIVPYYKDDELVTLDATIKFLSYEVRDDKEGNPSLLLLAEYTNLADEKRIPIQDFWYFTVSQTVEQEEVFLEEQAVISEKTAKDSKYSHTLGNKVSEVDPGETVEFIYSLKLENTNPVKLTMMSLVDEHIIGEKILNLE